MLLHPSNLFTYKSVSNNARLGELPFALVGFEVKSSGSCDNVQYSLTDIKPTGTEDEKLQYVLICGQQSTLMLATGGHDALCEDYGTVWQQQHYSLSGTVTTL